MDNTDRSTDIERRKKEWEENCLKPALKRFGAEESPSRFYSPADLKDFDFLEKVGFPGEYPFTAAAFPAPVPGVAVQKGASLGTGGGLVRGGEYAGYGSSEDMKDFYRMQHEKGWVKVGPRIAFQLPSQCGFDSDHPMAHGEVGKAGVAVDTLWDLETIYEAFEGIDLDKIAHVYIINGTANVLLAMLVAICEKRGVPINKIRATVQNDILKEIIARGNFVFPVKPSMRMTRDTITFCHEQMPLVNSVTINGFHIREAGATRTDTLAFELSNGIAYMQLGVDAGLNIDDFAHRINFGGFGGSMEVYKEIASRRAMRRMWAKIMKERFGAKKPQSWMLRTFEQNLGAYVNMTAQRPLNNLTRAVLTGVAGSMVNSGSIRVSPGFDEALGLGWSAEAHQLNDDASHILQYEAKLNEVIDPWAGSYFMESLTNQIEEDIWEVVRKIDSMGGAPAAIEQGYMQQQIARAAYADQRKVESGERMIVGVNIFTGSEEITVLPEIKERHPYDPERRAEAEKKQIANLQKVKRERNNEAVKACLKRLKEAAADESVNLMPLTIEAVREYASIGEICGTLREVFGEMKGASIW
ncbi:methylmalonyl-CoA mutase family protein [Chloroflexota bacterium]